MEKRLKVGIKQCFLLVFHVSFAARRKFAREKKPEPHPESPCWPPFLGPLASRAHRRPTQFSHTHVISSPISTTSVRNQREHEHTKSHRTHWSSSSSANSQSFLDDSRAQLLIPIPFRGWLPILFRSCGHMLPTCRTNLHSADMELPIVETWFGFLTTS